ncbi:MAG: glutamate--tRNA ligase family protein [Candidatus Pacearchaeota archaeon]|jgi:glutamyl-tRNA synthetase
MKNLNKKARAYALKNAISYGGKANQGAVVSGLFNEGMKKDEVKKYIREISEVVKKVNSLSVDKQKKEFEKLKNLVGKRPEREGLPELPNVKKSGVVMRFSPAPSGRLHIGGVRTAALSYLYVKKYGGKFYIRMDDSDPAKVNQESYDYIKEELKWLFGNSFEIIIISDRLKLYYKYAEKLIKKNSAYVCTCSGEDFRELAKEKKECPCRNNSVGENLKRWKKMLDKKGYKEGGAVLRFKSDMKHKNPAMRDFPLARINLTSHPIQKNKFRVWPLMNLIVSVDDIELKMTHIIRGKDHKDNAERQKMIFEVLGRKFPWTSFIGRYKFKGVDLSKRKITQGIKEGKYSGWDDEKLLTVASLKKKYSPEVFLKFTEHMGISEVDRIFDRKEFLRLLDTFKE